MGSQESTPRGVSPGHHYDGKLGQTSGEAEQTGSPEQPPVVAMGADPDDATIPDPSAEGVPVVPGQGTDTHSLSSENNNEQSGGGSNLSNSVEVVPENVKDSDVSKKTNVEPSPILSKETTREDTSDSARSTSSHNQTQKVNDEPKPSVVTDREIKLQSVDKSADIKPSTNITAIPPGQTKPDAQNMVSKDFIKSQGVNVDR
eukprot:Selendium_serpulae@DN6327_c4_g2_i4.p1